VEGWETQLLRRFSTY